MQLAQEFSGLGLSIEPAAKSPPMAGATPIPTSNMRSSAGQGQSGGRTPSTTYPQPYYASPPNARLQMRRPSAPHPLYAGPPAEAEEERQRPRSQPHPKPERYHTHPPPSYGFGHGHHQRSHSEAAAPLAPNCSQHRPSKSLMELDFLNQTRSKGYMFGSVKSRLRTIEDE